MTQVSYLDSEYEYDYFSVEHGCLNAIISINEKSHFNGKRDIIIPNTCKLFKTSRTFLSLLIQI